MTKTTSVAIWLIIFIAGLPLFSETVYTPALPDIATSLATSETLVEYTLTIYLFAFALGTMFWGKLSDFYGRKPCVLMGFAVYILGCIGCYFSNSIETLMVSRFVQAFGGSVGSVLGQAICRDAFHGPALGKVYSSIGAAMSVFPAIGPIVGGFVAQYFGWSATFLLLIVVGTFVLISVLIKLPETHARENRKRVNTLQLALKMLKDPRVVCCGLLVGACNGLNFCYFAEGPFYLINLLGLSPSLYGATFFATASSYLCGSIMSRKLHEHHAYHIIMTYGVKTLLVGASVFLLLILEAKYIPVYYIAFITVASMMVISIGLALIINNALYISLSEYRDVIGTASSIFGLFYYIIISAFTLGMGYFHNDTLLPMPLYFFCIAASVYIVFKVMMKYAKN